MVRFINPCHNIIDCFQIEDDWIYFWASKTEMCRVNLLDHSIVELYPIKGIVDGEYTSVSGIVYNSCLYYINYQNLSDCPDEINVVDLTNMSYLQIPCKNMRRIVQIYDRYLYVEAVYRESEGKNSLLRIDLQNNDIEEATKIEPKSPLQVRGEYLITTEQPELYIQQINGTKKKKITNNLLSETTFFADEDALYYIDNDGKVYKVDYTNYQEELLFEIDTSNEGMIFPFKWYSPGEYSNPSYIDTIGSEISRIYYKTGESLNVTVSVYQNSGLFQYSQNDLDVYASLYHEDDTVQQETFHPDGGKLVILKVSSDDSGITDINLFEVGNGAYEMRNEPCKKLMDADILAMSPKDVRYVVFAKDTSTKVGKYTSGGGAYQQYILFYIYDTETKELVYKDRVAGSAPPDSIMDSPNIDNDSGCGSYPIDEFTDELVGIWDALN